MTGSYTLLNDGDRLDLDISMVNGVSILNWWPSSLEVESIASKINSYGDSYTFKYGSNSDVGYIISGRSLDS